MVDNRDIMKLPSVTIKNLLEAGVHLGHKTFRWNPEMDKFIFGSKNSIHIIGIESEFTPENTHIAMEFDDNYFIGADNGIFSMIIGDFKADSIVEINIHKNYNNTITANDVFVKIATHISRDGKLEVVGKKIDAIKEIKGDVIDSKSIDVTKNKYFYFLF